MTNEKLRQLLRSEVADLHERVYSSAGDAFAHVAVREFFDADDEEALEWCDVGGSRDKGIDAFWIDEEDRRAILVQTKWAEKPKGFGADVIRQAESAYRWLLRLAEGKEGEAAPRVVDAARQLHKLREVEPDYPLSIFIIVAGTFTKGADEELQRVRDDLRRDPVDGTAVNLAELLVQVEERQSRDEGVVQEQPEITFTLEERGYFEQAEEDTPRALVATLDGLELAEAAHEWGYRRFMRNLRFFLPVRIQ